MKIIWRRPWVTKRDRERARSFMHTAELYSTIASAYQSMLNEPEVTENMVKRCECIERMAKASVESLHYCTRSAKALGFRNLSDCYEWYQKYGTI